MVTTANFLGKWTWTLTIDDIPLLHDDKYVQSGVVDDWPMALDRMNMAMGQYLQKQEEDN